jgi:hypothetical protein
MPSIPVFHEAHSPGGARQHRRESARSRLRLETRLYGLQGAWHQFRAYRSLEATAQGLPARDSYGVEDPNKAATWQSAQQQREVLSRLLRRHGFPSIEDFERTLAEYAAVLRTQVLALAWEMLAGYEQFLLQEERKYQSPSAAAALYKALSETQARQHYEQARSHEAEARRWGPDAELHRSLPGHREKQQAYQRLSAQARHQAAAQVLRVAPQHPLLAQEDFNRERLALAPPQQFQPLLLEYIRARRADITTTREFLAQRPDLVYKLDRVLAVLALEQDIQPGSLGELLLQVRGKELEAEEQSLALAVAVLALAAGLLSAGSGTVALLAAGASLGLGTYDALEQLRQYELKSAARGARLLSEDPSLAWVLLALLGLGLDVAAVVATVRAMRPALQAFHGSGDLEQLERSLKALAQVEERLKARVVQAARAEVQYRQAVRRLFSSFGLSHVSLVAGTEPFARAVAVFYYLLRRGVIAFERFLLELKAQRLIADIDRLAPEELARLKKAFEQGTEYVVEIVEHGEALKLSEEVGALVRSWSEGKAGHFTLEELKARLSARARELAEEARREAGAGVKPPGGKPGGPSRARKLAAAPVPNVHWREVFTPQEAEALLKAVLARTRGLSEALGEVAMQVALRRLRLKGDPRFIKRYHGAEEIAIDAEGRLVGVEAKGRARNAAGISKHTDDALQLSRKANFKRALHMRLKHTKIGKGSKRLGGAYTRGELELYQFLESRVGMKRLISTHFNASTGHTRVFERDSLGRIARPESGPLDEFTIDGLTELKENFKKKEPTR